MLLLPGAIVVPGMATGVLASAKPLRAMLLCSSVHATGCPVLRQRMLLRACYRMRVTDAVYQVVDGEGSWLRTVRGVKGHVSKVSEPSPLY